MKCIRCGDESWDGKICQSCMKNWKEMRKVIWDYHEKKYGKLNPDNLKIRQKETRKLEKLWRKNKVAFEQALKL